MKSENLTFSFIVYIFIPGVIVISAMVFPGILEFIILLVFGLYRHILNAIKKVLKLNFDYLPAIMISAVGIIGLMIGSIYLVIMRLTSLEITNVPISVSTFSIIFFIIGCILVPGIEKLRYIIKNKNIES